MKVKNKKTNVIKEVDSKMGALMIGTNEWEEIVETKEKKINVSGLGSAK